MRRLIRRQGKIAAVLLVAAYLSPGFALADEMVLCVAEDGRISVEEARGGRCVNSHDTPCGEASGAEEGSCPSSGDCCGSCLDLPIPVFSPHAKQVPAAKVLSHDPTALVGPCDSVDTLNDDSPVLHAGSPGVDPVARSALRILRSVVIII